MFSSWRLLNLAILCQNKDQAHASDEHNRGRLPPYWKAHMQRHTYGHFCRMKLPASHHSVSLFNLYLEPGIVQAWWRVRDRIVEAFDPRPPGLPVITEAMVLMKTPSLGHVQLVSVVQEILSAQWTQLLLCVFTSMDQPGIWLHCYGNI